MGRKLSLGDSEEVKYHGEIEEAEVQSDDGDANGDLSLGILAKANDRRIKRKFGSGKDPFPEIRTRNAAELSVDHEDNNAEKKALEIDTQTDGFKESLLNGERIGTAKDRGLLEAAAPAIADAAAVIGEEIRKKTKKKKKKTVEVDDQKTGEVEDNQVMRKLLRGPRYFDPPEEWEQLCHNCGKPGHYSTNCVERRPKPCYVCGVLGHEGKDCLQGIECFVCKKTGHYGKNCPDKRSKAKRKNASLRICLFCGDSGHDMLSCRNGYQYDDLKEIQCYICKRFGHLCCVDVMDCCPRELSCYNCGEKGHTGDGCTKGQGQGQGGTPKTCFKCGKEGHLVRGCAKHNNFDQWIADPATPSNEWSQGDTGFFGFRSVPREFSKLPRRTDGQAEGRKSVASGQRGAAKACFKCGEEGHLAVCCIKDDNFDRWTADPATPSNECSQEDPGFFGFRSVPREFGKLPKWTDVQAEERKSVASVEFRSRKSRRRGTAEGCIYTTPRKKDDMQAEGRQSVASVECRSRKSRRRGTAEGCIYTKPYEKDDVQAEARQSVASVEFRSRKGRRRGAAEGCIYTTPHKKDDVQAEGRQSVASEEFRSRKSRRRGTAEGCIYTTPHKIDNVQAEGRQSVASVEFRSRKSWRRGTAEGCIYTKPHKKDDVQAEGRQSVASVEFRSRKSWRRGAAEGCIYTTPHKKDDVQAEGRQSVALVEFRSRNSWKGDNAEGRLYNTL